jgi:hypothetical protein
MPTTRGVGAGFSRRGREAAFYGTQQLGLLSQINRDFRLM